MVDRMMTRRTYLTIKACAAGAGLHDAAEYVAGVALANPGWDMSEVRSYDQWEAPDE